jgi:hypothetical protein
MGQGGCIPCPIFYLDLPMENSLTNLFESINEWHFLSDTEKKMVIQLLTENLQQLALRDQFDLDSLMALKEKLTLFKTLPTQFKKIIDGFANLEVQAVFVDEEIFI